MSLYLGNTPICGGIEGNQLNNPFSLLDYKYSEYGLDNASWLLSNGQYNSGATYSAVYNLLLAIYNGTTTKAGVSVKLSTEAYADTDFVLNTTDITFRLPLKVALASGNKVAGNGMVLGWTNGTVNSSLTHLSGTGAVFNDNLFNKAIGTTETRDTSLASNTGMGITTDETKSGIETSANGLYLYFYVGETVQDANIIAAAGVLTDVADLKAHSIVETYVNGTSWYRVYSDGWCEQGGFVETGSAPTTVTLLKEMANTNYYANAMTNTTRTNPQNYDKIIQGKTTTSITVNQWNNWFDSFVWEVKGYIA